MAEWLMPGTANPLILVQFQLPPPNLRKEKMKIENENKNENFVPSELLDRALFNEIAEKVRQERKEIEKIDISI